jgi:hypothetical protein
MSYEIPSIANDGRWTVEFNDLRVRDEHQQRVAETIDRRILLDVLKLWLKVTAPGGQIIEKEDGAAWTVLFMTRSSARYFVSCFGGKLRSRLSP